MKITALQEKYSVNKMKPMKLSRGLAELMSVNGRSVAEKGHREDTVARKKRQAENLKKLTNRFDELEGAVWKKMSTVADYNFKLKEANRRAGQWHVKSTI